jgi:hypothetical protein
MKYFKFLSSYTDTSKTSQRVFQKYDKSFAHCILHRIFSRGDTAKTYGLMFITPTFSADYAYNEICLTEISMLFHNVVILFHNFYNNFIYTVIKFHYFTGTSASICRAGPVFVVCYYFAFLNPGQVQVEI